MKRSSSAVADQELGCAEQLARFFPQTAPVRIPVQVTALRASGPKPQEVTVVEFVGAGHAVFLSTLPVEFDDHVRLERASRVCAADATVVAVQYHEGRKAVAVRFNQASSDWMTRP